MQLAVGRLRKKRIADWTFVQAEVVGLAWRTVWELMMGRSLGIAATLTLLLAGCAPSTLEFRSLFRVELPPQKVGFDRDIVPISLRADPATVVAKLPKLGDRQGVALRLKNNYARLQLRWPLLPSRMPTRLTMIARSYWESNAIGTPRAKILLQLRFPLSPPPRQGATNTASLDMPDSSFLAGALDPIVVEQRALSTQGLHSRTIREDELIDGWLADLDMAIPKND